METVAEQDRYRFLLSIKEDKSRFDLMFEIFKNTLNPKELAIFFVNDHKYVDLYYQDSNDGNQYDFVSFCVRKVRNNDEAFKIFKERATETTLEICLECAKLMEDTELICLLMADTELISEETRRLLILEAIAKHDLQKVIELNTESITKYIFEAYEANFIKMIEYICKQEISYATLLIVLSKKQYDLFDLMVSMPGIDSEIFMIGVAMSNDKEMIDYVLKHTQFKYYTTSEGILSTLKFTSKSLFKMLIENPSVTDKVLDAVLCNMTENSLEAIKMLIQTRRCSKDLVDIIKEVFEDKDLTEIIANYY